MEEKKIAKNRACIQEFSISAKEANRITLNLQILHLHLQFFMRKLWSKSGKSGQSGSVINNAKT
jgi:hypothetical protein